MGLVEVATRLVASGVKSSHGRLDDHDRRPGRPADRAGLRRHRPGPAASAATTSYVLGHGAKTYLRQGCQWGPRVKWNMPWFCG